jgi:hypothetical protein
MVTKVSYSMKTPGKNLEIPCAVIADFTVLPGPLYPQTVIRRSAHVPQHQDIVQF